MKFVRFRKTASALYVVLVVAGSGCNVSADRDEGRRTIARVHSHMQAGDFAAIYKEADPAFRAVGSEAAFVAGLRNLQARLGSLKSAQELAYQTGWDSSLGATYILVFKLEYDHGLATERVVLGRAAAGKMAMLRLDIQPVEPR